jgi:phosphatidylserine/phosphatidylglycerophosphate/cardiolipin synthase-like enzyme
MNGRLHDKMFVVDESVYIVGGRNTWDRFLGDYGAKDESIDRELLVLATDPGDAESSVFALRAYFEALWTSDAADGFRSFGASYDDAEMEKERLRIRASAYTDFSPAFTGDFIEWLTAHTQPTDRVSLITGEIGIYGKSPDVWSEMKQLMLSATDRVVIQSPYIVCSRAMYRDLAEIDRTAPLTLVTDSILNTDNKFTPADYLYHQDEILGSGASILEYNGEKSTHAKTVLIDDSLVLIGSFNLDLRSTYMDTELMVVVDSEALGALVGESLSAYYADCTEVGAGTTVDALVGKMPFYKRVWYYAFGLVLQPFRFEL